MMNSRSVVRDVKAMSLGLDLINQEIDYWTKNSKKTKSTNKRIERLNVAKKHLIENPKKANELMNKLS
jgi:hypothetical protein